MYPVERHIVCFGKVHKTHSLFNFPFESRSIMRFCIRCVPLQQVKGVGPGIVYAVGVG